MKMKKTIACATALIWLGTGGGLLAEQNEQQKAASSQLRNAQAKATPKTEASTKPMAETAMTDTPTRFNKVSELIGMTVSNESGQRLGDIEDVVIDLDAGTVSYLVMGSGGVLGLGEKELAVPLHAFTINREEGCLELDATTQNISRAEGIGEDWPKVSEPSFAAMPFWRPSGETEAEANETSETGSAGSGESGSY